MLNFAANFFDKGQISRKFGERLFVQKCFKTLIIDSLFVLV